MITAQRKIFAIIEIKEMAKNRWEDDFCEYLENSPERVKKYLRDCTENITKE